MVYQLISEQKLFKSNTNKTKNNNLKSNIDKNVI